MGSYRDIIKKRLKISLVSAFLSFIFLFLIFYTGGRILPILVFIATFAVFIKFQKLPKIKCGNCSCCYKYYNVTNGSEMVVYGVCHNCKTKMNTDVPLTSG